MNPDALDIVGFATESCGGTLRSDDAMHFDARDWTPRMEAQARELQRDCYVLTKADRRGFTVRGYPVDAWKDGAPRPVESGANSDFATASTFGGWLP